MHSFLERYHSAHPNSKEARALVQAHCAIYNTVCNIMSLFLDVQYATPEEVIQQAYACNDDLIILNSACLASRNSRLSLQELRNGLINAFPGAPEDYKQIVRRGKGAYYNKFHDSVETAAFITSATEEFRDFQIDMIRKGLRISAARGDYEKKILTTQFMASFRKALPTQLEKLGWKQRPLEFDSNEPRLHAFDHIIKRCESFLHTKQDCPFSETDAFSVPEIARCISVNHLEDLEPMIPGYDPFNATPDQKAKAAALDETIRYKKAQDLLQPNTKVSDFLGYMRHRRMSELLGSGYIPGEFLEPPEHSLAHA